MTEYINAGLIGAGHLGKTHLRLLKEIDEENEKINLMGVYDADADVRKEISENGKVTVFKTLEDLLNVCNCVIIVTPTSTHYEIAEAALERGINTFIEKPVTSTPEDAEKLLKKVNKKGVKVQIGHIERFNPAILALDKYKLDPLFIESHRLAQFNPRGTDVSVIQDLMIHDIDIILNLVKSRVESIDANGVSIISGKIDIANARIKFENGCVVNVTASRISQYKMRKMRIFQRNAYISIDFLQNLSEVFKLTEENPGESAKDGAKIPGLGEIEIGDNKKIVYERPTIEDINPMKYELMKFFEAVMEDKEPIVTLEDGKQALEVATEIIKSVEDSLKRYKKS